MSTTVDCAQSRRSMNIMSLFSGPDREGREVTNLGRAAGSIDGQLPAGHRNVGCSSEDAGCFVRDRKMASNN